MLTSGVAIELASPSPGIPKTPAARIEFVMNLMHPPIYCDCGCGKVVGRGDPLITREQAAELLDVPGLESC